MSGAHSRVDSSKVGTLMEGQYTQEEEQAWNMLRLGYL